MHRLPFLLLVLVLAAGAAHAAPKSVSATRAAEPPKVDGVLNDACWAGAAPLGDFVLLGKDAPAREQTTARILYDDRALYFGIQCRESAMGKLVASQKKRDPAVCGDDCVEIFLDPNHDRFNYYHFAVNALGTQFDESGDGAGVAADWSAVWEAKTSRAADSWSVEVAIPFAVLGISRKVGQTWGLNVCRSERPAGELSSWSPTGAKFAAPQAFGELTGVQVEFAPYLLTLGVPDWGQQILGGNTAAVRVTNDGKAPRNLTLRLTLTPPTEHPRPVEVPLGVVAPGSTATAKAPYQMFEAGDHALAVEVLDAGDRNRVCAATGKRVSVAPLAEFEVFKSFYRDDVSIGYRVNAQAADLAKYRVRATLAPAGAPDKPLATREVARLAGAQGEVRFDTAKLPVGEYTIRAEVLDRSGKSAAARDLHFPMLRRPVPRRLVEIDPDNFLRVDGKRVFPIGIYATPGSEKSLRDLREAGFSLIHSGALPGDALKALLDKAQQHGLKVWVALGGVLDFSTGAEKKRKELEDLVAAAGEHPALLLWESIDEPAWGSQSAEGLYEGYKFLRALDQHHPIWTNHAPRNFISTLAYYNRATDMAGCDIYPVPEPQSHSNLPNRTIHATGDETDKSLATVNGQKPVIMVLQGFGWAELSRQAGKKPNAVMPTFAESRFMAYDAIVHGARAINYWGTAYTEKPSRFYGELKSLVSELAAMEPVLTAEIVTGARAGRVRSPEDAVQMMRRSLGGRTYLIATNTRKQSCRAEFQLPGLAAGALGVLFEERTVATRAGAFADDFEPYAVHLYTDDPAFRPKRKEFTAEMARIPAAEVPLSEAGNLVENPSFEVDQDEDLVPERWAANHPFTMQASEEQAHSGKRSLMLTSTAKGFTPLAVQHSVGGIRGDAAYTLSGWVKTDRPGLEVRIYVEWHIGDGWYGKVLPWTAGTGEWQRVEVPFKATPDPAGTAYVVVQIKGEGRAWFDDVAVRAGE